MKTQRFRKRLTDIVSSLVKMKSVIIFAITRQNRVKKIMFEQM